MELTAKHGHVVKELRLLRGTGSSGPLLADRWRARGMAEGGVRLRLPFVSDALCAIGRVLRRMNVSLPADGHRC